MTTDYEEWLEEEMETLDLEDRLNYLFRFSNTSQELEEDAEKEYAYAMGGL